MSLATTRPSQRQAARGSGLLMPLLLATIAIISAVWAVQIKHENRHLNDDSNKLRDTRDRLEVEWSQLQLEEAAHSSHARVESIARHQLKMVEPRETVMVPSVGAIP